MYVCNAFDADKYITCGVKTTTGLSSANTNTNTPTAVLALAGALSPTVWSTKTHDFLVFEKFVKNLSEIRKI
jgi:hypothetical protein